MKKIVMIYDQIQAGVGTKDDANCGLGILKEPAGPAVMMENYLRQNDAKVIACLYCGTQYYQDHQAEVDEKMSKMISKINPDCVICGPCFNFVNYANMALHLTKVLQKQVPCFCALSPSNHELINDFKDQVLMIKTPDKGGSGLNASLHNMVLLADKLINNQPLDTLESELLK